MKPETLKEIKVRLEKLHKVVRSLSNYWESFPMYTMISVLVQNVAYDASDCVNYSHIKEEKKLQTVLALLKQLADYDKSYFQQWVYDEVSIIIQGETLSEDLDDVYLANNWTVTESCGSFD